MYPTINLQPGARGPEVQKLQQFLLEQGYLTAEQIATGPGIYGPQTTNAVKRWQSDNGVDNTTGPGYWGPRSISAASGVSGTGTPATGPETQESVDKRYTEAAANNPVIAELSQGGSSIEEIVHALSTGNLAGIYDWNGQPFSAQDQQEALAKAKEDNKLYFEALRKKEEADAVAKMESQKADYQDYLINAGQAFEADKTKSDQQAANQGILFSGSRVQREKNLKRAYEQDQSSYQRRIGGNIANTARDFQYKYGTDAAKGLNQYYNLGGNTFNPNVVRGGVGSSGLSSIYSPGSYNYQGTRNVEKETAAQQRAAGYLWNKGNKLMRTGYQNQY